MLNYKNFKAFKCGLLTYNSKEEPRSRLMTKKNEQKN